METWVVEQWMDRAQERCGAMVWGAIEMCGALAFRA